MNFYAEIKDRFASRRDAPFLSVPGGRSVTYGEMDALSAQYVGVFNRLGLRQGDRIVAQVKKSIENIALYLGVLRAGLVYVPLNTAYTPGEVEYFLNDAEPSLFVCDPDKHDALVKFARDNGVRQILTLDGDGEGTLGEAAQTSDAINDVAHIERKALASILYTSGTTGRSKGAMLSHKNLSVNAHSLVKLWRFTSNDRLVHALPVFHIHGLFVALHTAILSGCEIIFLPKFDVDAVLDALPQASVMMGVPTFYTRLLARKEFGQRQCSKMRLFISGSAPLLPDTFEEFAARTGAKILERYGMSEAGMIASNPVDGERKAGSVGFALPSVSIRIRGDGDKIAPVGEIGSVEVSGENVFSGYWRMAEKTKAEFCDDGYFITGDQGYLDEQGRLTLVGRATDMIISGGLNIYPKEIELVLGALESVAEAAVIGAPHPDFGESPVGVLVAKSSPPKITVIEEALSNIAKFKHPRKFIWVDALPRNAMGKVQKQVLRDKFADIFKMQ